MSAEGNVWSLQRNDAVWARRAHPASFWIRLAVLPAFGATLWIRQWVDPGFLVVLLALFVLSWASERLFPAPGDTAAWASRASMGERLLASSRPLPDDVSRPLLRGLAVTGTVGTIVMVSGAILFDPTVTGIGMVLMLGAKLVYFDRLARLFDRAAQHDPEVAAWRHPT